MEAGYGIELDVQLSSDGVPVVFHDDRLTRMCGVEGRVCDRTAAELCELPLAGREGVCVPTFADVLAAVGGRSPLIVEIKYAAGWQVTLEAAMALLDAYDGPYCIESFHPMVLSWLRRHRQRVLRGQLNMRLRGVLPRRTAFQVCGNNKELTFVALVNNDTGFKCSEGDTAIAVGLRKGSSLNEKVSAAIDAMSAAERSELMKKMVEIAPAEE